MMNSVAKKETIFADSPGRVEVDLFTLSLWQELRSGPQLNGSLVRPWAEDQLSCVWTPNPGLTETVRW